MTSICFAGSRRSMTALCFLFAVYSSIAAENTDAPKPERAGWKLVWSDEFDTDGAPDPKKWGYEVGFVRNGELQYYTQDRRENARVEKGSLVIEARSSSPGRTGPGPKLSGIDLELVEI